MSYANIRSNVLFLWLAKQQQKLMNQKGRKNGLLETWKKLMWMSAEAREDEFGGLQDRRKVVWEDKLPLHQWSRLPGLGCMERSTSSGIMVINHLPGLQVEERRCHRGHMLGSDLLLFLTCCFSFSPPSCSSVCITPDLAVKGTDRATKRSDCLERLLEKLSMRKVSEMDNWSFGICYGSNIPS